MVNEAGRPREGTNGPAREHTRGRGVLKKRPVSPSATGWFEKRGLGLSKGDRIQDPPPGPRPRAPGLHENHLAVIGGGGGHQHEEQEKEEEEAARPGPGPPAPRHVGLPLGGEGEGGRADTSAAARRLSGRWGDLREAYLRMLRAIPRFNGVAEGKPNATDAIATAEAVQAWPASLVCAEKNSGEICDDWG